jgi:ubiquinone biosynthesis protein
MLMAFWASLRRLGHIAAVLVKHLLAHVVGGRLARWPWLAHRLPHRTLSGPERLRTLFEDLGGTFIKFGQMLALQPDILPLAYCNALFNLLDRITPFGFEQVERIFVTEFGSRPAEIFDHFDPQPIATASIGQVYVAYLGERKVAVKVQRPSIQTDFAGDIRLMTVAIRLINTLRVKKLCWMIEPMSEFVAWTREELDYRCEARYLEQIRRNSRDNAKESVPLVFWEYTTHCILTIEFLEGVTVLDYIRALEAGDELMVQRLRTMGFEPNQFARNIIENFLTDAFRHGMFHADLHPANLMICSDNTVGYIDYGITGVLSPYLRRHLVALTLAYSRGDLDGMYTLFFKVSALEPQADAEGFRNGLRVLAGEWYMMEGTKRRLIKNITLVMLDLLKLSHKTGVWPERDVIKYIRSSIAIDGLITRFAPAFDVGKYLEMVCDRYLTWQARQELFAFDTLVDWSRSSGRLMRDGPLRAATILQRIAGSEIPAHAAFSPMAEESDGARRQAVQLAAVVFAVSVMMTLTGEAVQFGVNLFTAEVLLMAAAAAMLLRTIHRLI